MPVNTNDFIVGFDPTGSTTITGAQLAQLVNSAHPQVDKGMAILTADVAGVPEVPNATTTTKWKRYLWVRQSVSSVGLYVWNDNANPAATYLKWQSINISGIGDESIVNAMIVNNTIKDGKIANLSYSKLIDVPTGFAPSGAAGGDLTGDYPSPIVGLLKIDVTKIANLTITAAKVETCAGATTGLDYTKLRGDGVLNDMLRSKADSTQEWFTPNDLVKATTAQVMLAASGLKYPRVNAGATAFEMANVCILQKKVISSVTAYNAAVVAAGAITGASGTDVADLKITNFVPLSATSHVHVRVCGTGKKTTNAGHALLALTIVATGAAHGAGVAAVAAGGLYRAQDANNTQTYVVEYGYVPGATTGIDVYVGFLATTADAVFNASNGYTVGGVAAQNSFIEITEYTAS
jgi:hypothetical protein